MDRLEIPLPLILVGPILGLAAARAFGRLTWPRALLASALATAAVVLLTLALTGNLFGMPRRVYRYEEETSELVRQTYLIAGGFGAILGLFWGAVVYGIIRIGVRLARGRTRSPVPPA